MSGSTTHGLPYPLGTDPISQGDDVAMALATALDRLMGSAAGQAGIPFSASATGSVAVTFPAGRFKAIPAVVAIAQDSSLIFCTAGNITLTGYTMSGRVWNGSAITATVLANWYAIEKG